MASVSLFFTARNDRLWNSFTTKQPVVVGRLALLTRHTFDALLKATPLSLPYGDERQTAGRRLNPIYFNLTLLLFTGHDGSVPEPTEPKRLMGPPITVLSYDTQRA